MVSSEESRLTDIYNRHVDMVLRICFMFLRDEADSEDAVQTVFLKLIQAGKTFNDLEHEKAWLIVTAQNHCKIIIELLYLYYFEGYSSKEIADLLRIKDSTVRTQLRVGRKQSKLHQQSSFSCYCRKELLARIRVEGSFFCF
ncbi:RNA polymerase sigma factor ['Paenibacillus yunnanensis' Narsing Rao et al. 2020]|uniref:RNA polymerase sigma factor n=1 Tax=Paenibacillus tengchongensis TaxID=2608684 RepID=UPI00124D9AA2|nr:sigma-70 family RNA polymerase sigma factor [Paenibacillus tengchongensis]